jgi:hypothetical protein
VEQAIDETLDEMSAPLIAVTSLAIGADQLLARRVLARGGRIHAVLPFRDIDRTFADDSLAAYQHLIGRAVVEVLDTDGTDEDAYLAAGKRVVDLAEVMIAVWDGRPAKGKGGTADIVRYTTDRKVPLVHIDPARRTVHKSVGN